MGRFSALLSQMPERVLGFAALIAVWSLFFGSGIDGDFWRSARYVNANDETLTMVTGGLLAIAAFIFLIPGLSSLLSRPTISAPARFAKRLLHLALAVFTFGASVSILKMEPLLPDAVFKFVVVAAAVALLVFVFSRVLATDEAYQDAMDELTVVADDPVAEPAYRILDTQADNEAVASIEERRRRLMQSAEFNNLPRHVREAFVRMSPIRVFLCLVVVLPLVVVVGAGFFGAFATQFLPTQEVQEMARRQTGPVILYSVIAGAFLAAFGPRYTTRRKRPRSRVAVGVLYCALFALLARLSVYSAISMGAPGLHVLYVGGPAATAAVIVVARDNEKAIFCGRWADIRVSPKAPRHRLCGLDATLADAIISGEQIFLTGVATKYGLRYHEVRH